jgi:hypothetical protein
MMEKNWLLLAMRCNNTAERVILWVFFVFIWRLRSFCHQLAKKCKKNIANDFGVPIMPPHQRDDVFLVSSSQCVDNLLVAGGLNLVAVFELDS